MDQIEAFNRAWFLKINADPHSSLWLVRVAILMAEGWIYLIPAMLAAMWLWGGEARRNLAMKAFLVAMLGLGLNLAIAHLWPHPRPFMIFFGRTLIPHVADSSFPSDHITIFFSIGLSLVVGNELRYGLAILAAGAGAAWARVFLGVHFPLDTLGSVGVAALSLAGITLCWPNLGQVVLRFTERMYRKTLALPIASGWFSR